MKSIFFSFIFPVLTFFHIALDVIIWKSAYHIEWQLYILEYLAELKFQLLEMFHYLLKHLMGMMFDADLINLFNIDFSWSTMHNFYVVFCLIEIWYMLQYVKLFNCFSITWPLFVYEKSFKKYSLWFINPINKLI